MLDSGCGVVSRVIGWCIGVEVSLNVCMISRVFFAGRTWVSRIRLVIWCVHSCIHHTCRVLSWRLWKLFTPLSTLLSRIFLGSRHDSTRLDITTFQHNSQHHRQHILLHIKIQKKIKGMMLVFAVGQGVLMSKYCSLLGCRDGDVFVPYRSFPTRGLNGRAHSSSSRSFSNACKLITDGTSRSIHVA